jgi:hypothetical protein
LIPPVGIVWDAPPSFLERLALETWRAAGHAVAVAAAARPAGLADDMRWIDAAPLFAGAAAGDRAGLARLRLLAAEPGMLTVAPDLCALRPFAATGVVLARARPGEAAIGEAVLALPADAPLLAALLAEAARPGAAADLAALLTRLVPLHLPDAPVLPAGAVAPVAFAHRQRLLRPPRAAGAPIGGEAMALRLWPATRRDLAARHGGVAPAGSFLAAFAARHGIDPAADPVPAATAGAVGADAADAAAILDRLGDRIGVLADVGGTAPALAVAAHARFDCDLVAIDIDAAGQFPETPSPWVAPYRAALAAAGVPDRRLRILRGPGGLRPVDAILNLGGFGDTAKVRHLAPLLDRCLHADTVMLTDIRKGSGAWPFLKARGTVEPVGTTGDVTRVLFRPQPPAATATDPVWAAMARALAGPSGFFREGPGHSFLYIPRGRTLVVTFDNLDLVMVKREDRRAWGHAFVEKQGWSMLGVMAEGWTWYRDPWVLAEFDRLRNEGFFAGFERVVFYGASMGGYAACAFVPACPGADVVAIAPQSTLDRRLVPWETRYRAAWDRDFSGRYGDAAMVSAAAGRVTILYDPYEPLDAAHVARFQGPNVVRLRAPLFGHRLGTSLHQMGVLNAIILGALDGTLTPAAFYGALRARRDFPRYHRELFERAALRHPALARRLGEWVLARGDNRAIREGLRRL